MKLTVLDLIHKGKWEDFCKLKGLDPHDVARGAIDDQMLVTLTPEEVKILDLAPKTSVCGHADN
jgi:hypothetical protein